MKPAIRNQKAFSLIELMIVVAIIGILAAVAAPAYFSHVIRARQVEGINNMLDIKMAQEKFYVLNDEYVTSDTQSNYADFIAMLNIPPEMLSFSATVTMYKYTLSSADRTKTFTITSANDLNNDNVREDCWTVTDSTEPVQKTAGGNCKADGEGLDFSILTNLF